VAEALFPGRVLSAYDGYYASLMRLVPDQRLIFMNHGYAAEIAEDFRWVRDDDWVWRYSMNLVRHVLAGVDVAGCRVLDIGCGRGGGCAYIAGYLGPKLIAGIDTCTEAIRFCRLRHQAAGLHFVAGRAEQLPWRDESFDVVLNIESSHCYPDLGAFFQQVTRVLSPAGFFCYADNFTPARLARTGDLLARSASFRVLRATDITAAVARAIALNRAVFSNLLSSMVDPDLENFAIVADLIRSINVHSYQKYMSGQWLYHAWLLERRSVP
jgi:O-methyltransferase